MFVRVVVVLKIGSRVGKQSKARVVSSLEIFARLGDF